MNKVLILDNYDSFTYNLAHYVEANPDYEVAVFRNDEISIDEVDKYDTIILSPGPGLPEDAGILKALIKRYAPTKKILGVCLGMQAIGEVFGGTLLNLDTVFHGVATTIQIVDREDGLYKGLPESFAVGRYHSWVVANEGFPKELHITSVEENGQVMSLKHKDYKLYGVQYHPESILTEHGKEMITNFLSL